MTPTPDLMKPPGLKTTTMLAPSAPVWLADHVPDAVAAEAVVWIKYSVAQLRVEPPLLRMTVKPPPAVLVVSATPADEAEAKTISLLAAGVIAFADHVVWLTCVLVWDASTDAEPVPTPVKLDAITILPPVEEP
jgi:hypothetical protein